MAIPPAERSLLVLLGHAMNEVNVLTKLFLISSRFEKEPRWYAHGQSCQALVLGRTLTGKLHEIWQFIAKGYLRTPLSRKYSAHLDDEGQQALALLKSYFGRKNLITTVRNSFAFHYSLTAAETEVSDDVPPEELSIYFGPTNGTSLYQFSEQVMGMAMLRSINHTDNAAAFDALITDTSSVTSWLNSFAQRLMYLILETALGQAAMQEMLRPMKVSAPHSATQVRLPYFVNVTGGRRAKGAANPLRSTNGRPPGLGKPGRVTVPGKPSDDLAPGTLNSILKQASLKS